jgi:Tol biopolymer transport system component
LLTSAANGWPASWSADGSLVYLQYSTTGGKGLRILDLEGHVTQVEHPAFDSARDFVPSPDGRYLAYQSYELDGAPVAGLFTMPLDSATGLPSPGAESTPVASGYPSFCWSPDSRSLIYSPGDGIHEVAVDGTGRRVLVDAPFGEYRDALPQVSPDGHWLLFVRQSSREAGTGFDSGYLYVARRDGSEPLQVGYGQRPLWVNGGLGDVEGAEPPPAPNPLYRPVPID